jgi:ribosomal protein L35AE/L33A
MKRFHLLPGKKDTIRRQYEPTILSAIYENPEGKTMSELESFVDRITAWRILHRKLMPKKWVRYDKATRRYKPNPNYIFSKPPISTKAGLVKISEIETQEEVSEAVSFVNIWKSDQSQSVTNPREFIEPHLAKLWLEYILFLEKLQQVETRSEAENFYDFFVRRNLEPRFSIITHALWMNRRKASLKSLDQTTVMIRPIP